MVLEAVPPEKTFSVPPPLTVALKLEPPEETFSVPPLNTLPLTLPPETF